MNIHTPDREERVRSGKLSQLAKDNAASAARAEERALRRDREAKQRAELGDDYIEWTGMDRAFAMTTTSRGDYQ